MVEVGRYLEFFQANWIVLDPMRGPVSKHEVKGNSERHKTFTSGLHTCMHEHVTDTHTYMHTLIHTCTWTTHMFNRKKTYKTGVVDLAYNLRN